MDNLLNFLTVWLHFKPESITPHSNVRGLGSSSYTIICQKLEYHNENIVLSFLPRDLDSKNVKQIILGRELKPYGDSTQKYIEIPITELYTATVRTNNR